MPSDTQLPLEQLPQGTTETSIEPGIRIIEATVIAVKEYEEVENIAGTACRHSTIFYNAEWAAGFTGTTYSGQMFAEKFEPLELSNNLIIVLIHGDFHTGASWSTKPDGKPGWASAFLKKGYTVYLVDLPGCGRSPFLHREDYGIRDLADQSNTLLASSVEQELTAPERYPYSDNEPAWPTAPLHNQWPGTGERGDPIFDQYMASTATMSLRKIEREALAQIALKDLLKKIGPSVLIGHGSGCTAAWLAADAVPNLVLGVIALEPVGPPCARAFQPTAWGRKYSPYLSYDAGVRKYGLSDILLTYSPAAKTPTKENPEVLDLAVRQLSDNSGCYITQTPIPGLHIRNPKLGQEPVRQLVELKRMPHVVVTGQASFHSVFDWATVLFMRQAGVDVDHYNLAEMGITGNGNLMFLEKNSDEIAHVLGKWMEANTTRNNLLSPEYWPAARAQTRAPEEAPNQNQPGINGQAANATIGNRENPDSALNQNDQAVILAQQNAMAGILQEGIAEADAGNQAQHQMAFNGGVFANNDGANMVGQQVQGIANLPIGPFPAHIGGQIPLPFEQFGSLGSHGSFDSFNSPDSFSTPASSQNTLPFELFPNATSPPVGPFRPHANPEATLTLPGTVEGLFGRGTAMEFDSEQLPSFYLEQESLFDSAFYERDPQFVDQYTLALDFSNPDEEI